MAAARVDTDLLAHLGDEHHRMLAHLEDAGGTLRRLCSQMLTEDAALTAFPGWQQVCEMCSSALKTCERLTETAAELAAVLDAAPQRYLELEQAHRQCIERLTVQMTGLKADLAGIFAPEYPLGLAEGEERSAVHEREQQSGHGMQEPEMTDLSAVTQILKDQYRFAAVIPETPPARRHESEEEDTP